MKVAQLCPTRCDPMDYIVHEILQARIPELVAISFSRGSSQPRDQTEISRISGRSIPAKLPRKPKNWSGSPSLCQGIFPTQESNWGLLHGRRILYQLSYQGSPCELRHKINYKLLWIPSVSIFNLCITFSIWLHLYTYGCSLQSQ